MKISGEKDLDTVLDDSAAIYRKREDKTEKQKFSELKGREKLQYFKDYYLKRIIIIIVCAALVISVGYSILKPKPVNVLYTIILNNPFPQETLDDMTAKVSERLVTDSDKEQVMIDGTYYLNGDDYAARMKMVAVIAAGEIDVIIAPKDEFTLQTNNEIFMKIDEALPAELLSKLKDKLVYITPVSSDALTEEVTVGENAAYGILLDDYIKSIGGTNPQDNPYMMGFVLNSSHKEAIADYVSFMCNIE